MRVAKKQFLSIVQMCAKHVRVLKLNLVRLPVLVEVVVVKVFRQLNRDPL